MLCPCCKTKLVVTGQERLETLEEHVSCVDPCLKDKYECPNPSCATYQKCCWNEDGEHYQSFSDKFPFIDNNSGPFGSFSRRINVEIYKHDEDRELFKLGRFKFKLVYSYKANEDGEILSRKRRIETWLKTRDDDWGYTLYISGIHMLIFSIKQFHWERKRFGDSSSHVQGRLDKENWFNKDDWWRVVACWYARTFVKLFPQKVKQTA